MQHTLAYGGDNYTGLPSRNAPGVLGAGIFKSTKGHASYIGEYTGSRMHGIGVHTWSDGSWYSGQWTQGERDGHGVYHIARQAEVPVRCTPVQRCCDAPTTARCVPQSRSTSFYRGQYTADMREGHGVERYGNGGVYCGQWKRGGKDGQVTSTRPCRSALHRVELCCS
jgi:hypothetical protein